MKPKILFLTKYSNLGASSRLRTLQYLKNFNFNFTVNSLFDNNYIKALYENKSKLYILLYSYFNRISFLYKNKIKFFYIEKELFPYLPYFFEYFFLRNKDYILDYDDAIFHNYDNHKSKFIRLILRNKIPALIRNAKLVIVGNEYLKKYAIKYGAKNVELIPTSVDLHKYNYVPKTYNSDIFTIGWIGSPSTQNYLTIIHDALKIISKIYRIKLKVIGISDYSIKGINVECEEWSEINETKLLSEIDLGVMPLPNNPFEKGKCGYKIIQYGASYKASVASPVGINNKIISQGINGFLAENTEEWVTYICKIINDKALRGQLGFNARINVEKKFSTKINSKILQNVILSIQ